MAWDDEYPDAQSTTPPVVSAQAAAETKGSWEDQYPDAENPPTENAGMEAQRQADIQRTAQSVSDQTGSFGKSWVARTGKRLVTGLGADVGIPLTTAAAYAGIPGAEETLGTLYRGRDIDQAVQAIQDREAGGVSGATSKAVALTGNALLRSTLPGGLIGQTALTSGTENLTHSDQSLGTGLAHTAIDTGSMYIGGEIGTPLAKLAGVSAEAGGKIIPALIGEDAGAAAKIAAGATSQTGLAAATNAAHYLTDVAAGKEEYDGDKFKERITAGLPENAIAGAIGESINSVVHAANRAHEGETAREEARDWLSQNPDEEQLAQARAAKNKQQFEEATGAKKTNKNYRQNFMDEISAKPPTEEAASAAPSEGTPEQESNKTIFDTELPLDSIKKVLNPRSASEEAGKTAELLQYRNGEMSHNYAKAAAALEEAKAHFDTQPVDLTRQVIYDMEGGKPQSDPKLQAFADTMRKLLSDKAKEIQDAGKAQGKKWLKSLIQNYFPHLWKNPDSPETASILSKIFSKKSLTGDPAFLHERTIESTKEGIAEGLEPVTENPAELVLLKLQEMDKFLMGQKFFGDLKNHGLSQYVKIGERAPEGWKPLNDKLGKVISDISEDGEAPIRVIRGFWHVPESAGRIVDNYLQPGLRGQGWYEALRQPGNALNQAQLAFPVFHGTMTTINTMASSLSLAIEQASKGNFTEAAKNVLRTSPWGVYRAWKLGKQMEHAFKQDMASIKDPLMRNMVQSMIQANAKPGSAAMWGGTEFHQNSAISKFFAAMKAEPGSEKRSLTPESVLRSPFAAAEYVAKPMQEYFIPRVKLGVFYDMAMRRLAEAGPNAHPEDVRGLLQKDWDSVENRLGQMTYDNLHWNKVIKDIGMASTRSLGWNLGSIREGVGAVTDLATIGRRLKSGGDAVTQRMAFAVAMPALVGIIGSAVQYMYTGQSPQSMADLYWPRTGRQNPDGTDERIGIPSYMRDVFAWSKAATEGPKAVATVVGHKMNPLLSEVVDMLNNQDYYGSQIRNPDDPWVKQVAQAATYQADKFKPFPYKAWEKANEEGRNPYTALLGETPAPASITRSPAMQKAVDYIRESMPEGRTPEQASKAAEVNQIKVAARRGDLEPLRRAIKAGKLDKAEATNIVNNVHKDPLSAAIGHVTAEQALSVWKEASEGERSQIRAAVIKKVFDTAKRGTPVDALPLIKRAKSLGVF